MKTDIRIVVLDKTQDWNYPPEDIEKYFGKFYNVFLYDKNQVTNACEITPSYDLRYIDTITEKSLSDAQHDEIHEAIFDNQDEYQHCGFIDSIEEKFNFKPTDSFDKEYQSEEEHNEIMEEAMEYYRGNGSVYGGHLVQHGVFPDDPNDKG